MATNYKQPQYVEKRVRFFENQDIFAQDSIDEQNYHIDRQRRHSRTLHVSGICDGLTVGVEGKAISVDAGTALDQTGRLIVLGQKQKISVPDKNSEVKLVIFYQELESDPAKEGPHGNTRWHEQPKLEILPKETVPQDGICLATLKIKSNGEVEVDNTVRQYSGVRLPAGDGQGATLRTHSDENPNLAILDGSLSISGTLEVKGESTLTSNVNANGSLTVTGTTQLNNTLTVQENTSLQKDLNVKGTVTAEAFVGDGAVIKGMILMWSGGVKDIPEGWALCDGKNSTPDLRSRFIVGAESDSEGEYLPGNKGDADTHAHWIQVPAKKFYTDNAGNHTHKPPQDWYKFDHHDHTAFDKDDTWSLIDCSGGDVKNQQTTENGEHSHNLSVEIDSFTSDYSSGQNRPKWYALCFIVKL